MEKNMNSILDDVKDLKELIMDSSEYKEYINSTKIIENNKEITDIIERIKSYQKEIVKTKNTDLEVDIDLLFDKLYSFKEYNDYIISSEKLNKLITKIQKEFEKDFNEILN